MSCIPQEQQDTVVVETKGIEEVPTVEIENNGDLGEFLIDSDPHITELKIKNNSQFDIFDIDLKFEKSFESNADINYMPNELDEAIFPGLDGTCDRKLAPGDLCSVFLKFNPDRRGVFIKI